MNFKNISIAIFSFLIGSLGSSAQEVEDNMRMVKAFKADGISNEWNEPLNQYNDATKLAFALANDDRNLYIVIESLDPQTTFSILSGGITLNINTEGKKKNGVNLIFPLIEKLPMPKESERGNKEIESIPKEKKEVIHDFSSMNKSIKVVGFKDIKDGDLPLINDYGIETGMTIGLQKDFIYELCIPLAQLHVNLNLKKPLMYNIKINSPTKPYFKKVTKPQGVGGPFGGGMGQGGMDGRGNMLGGGMGRGGHGQRSIEVRETAIKSSDFWIKFKLVKS